jgi:hypothetical protein
MTVNNEAHASYMLERWSFGVLESKFWSVGALVYGGRLPLRPHPGPPYMTRQLLKQPPANSSNTPARNKYSLLTVSLKVTYYCSTSSAPKSLHLASLNSPHYSSIC